MGNIWPSFEVQVVFAKSVYFTYNEHLSTESNLQNVQLDWNKISEIERGSGISLMLQFLNSQKKGMDVLLGEPKNIAKIAKAASQKLPGKSSLNFSFVRSCPDHHDHHVHHDHHDHSDNDDHGVHEDVGGYVRKLKVVYKEIGD